MIWMTVTTFLVVDICADSELMCKPRKQDGANILQTEQQEAINIVKSANHCNHSLWRS